MGFYSSLIFYRPTPPPFVTGARLAEFIDRFDALGVIKGGQWRAVKVKYGTAIDQNDRRLNEPEEIVEEEHCSISTIREQSLDVNWNNDEDQADRTPPTSRGDARSVYRAFVSLGSAHQALFDALRFDTPKNGDSFAPSSWSLELGVISTEALGGDEAFHVGWIGVSLSGNGYCFPRTMREIVDLARAQSDVQRVERLCREFWPVAPQAPSKHQQALRKKMGGLWPYDRVDLPLDWSWTLSEGG